MSRGTLDPAALHRTSATGLSPSPAGLPSAIPLSFSVALAVRTPPCTHSGLGSSGSARRYSRNRCFFLFLRLLRCFSSPGSPPHPIHGISALFHMRMHGVFPCGFPHSDIRGSVDICSSPRLFAAYHVFLRLSVPRHPPCALSSLTSRCIALQRLFFFSASSSFLACLLFLRAVPAASRTPVPRMSFHCFGSFSIRFSRYLPGPFPFRGAALMGLSGLEPPTSRLSGVRSNRLSYKPQ